MIEQIGYGTYRKHLTYYYTALQIIEHFKIPMEGTVNLQKSKEEMDAIIKQMKRAIVEKNYWKNLYTKNETKNDHKLQVALYLWGIRKKLPENVTKTEDASPGCVIEVFRTSIKRAKEYIDKNKDHFPTYVLEEYAGKKIDEESGHLKEAKELFNETLDKRLYEKISEDMNTIKVRPKYKNEDDNHDIINIVFLKNIEGQIFHSAISNSPANEYVVPVILDRNSPKFERPFKPRRGNTNQPKDMIYSQRKLSPLEKKLLNLCEFENELASVLTYYNHEYLRKYQSFDSLNIKGYLDPNDPYIVFYNIAGRVVGKKRKNHKIAFYLDESIEGFKWGFIAKSQNQIIEDMEKQRVKDIRKNEKAKQKNQIGLWD